MCFDRNKKRDTLLEWYFKGFVDESSPWLKYIQVLPSRPTFPMRQYASYFDPEWEIRINTEHILDDAENVQRLPEAIREAWNLPLLLETAVELARRKALVDHTVPSITARPKNRQWSEVIHRKAQRCTLDFDRALCYTHGIGVT